MTTTFTDLMPAHTTAPTTGEEVNSMSIFNFDFRQRQNADLDRLVVLERLKHRRRVQRHVRSVHSQLWGVRANR